MTSNFLFYFKTPSTSVVLAEGNRHAKEAWRVFKNSPNTARFATNIFGSLVKKSTCNHHSNLEPPQPDDGLRGEFLDIYVEHSQKKYRVNTVKRKTNKKRAKSRQRQKPKPKATIPHFAGQVPPPIEFPDVNIKTEGRAVNITTKPRNGVTTLR